MATFSALGRRLLQGGPFLVAAVLVAGCGTISSTPPPATPTDFPGMAGRLNAAGIEARDWISGEPGCADDELRKTAIRFEASGLDQTEPATLYLYVFRNREAFERNRARVGPCAGEYVTDAETFEQVEQSPYVVAGQGPWAPEFEAALRRTLELAAGTGG
jgi:hypothetical protein